VHSVDHSYDWQVTLAYTGELTMRAPGSRALPNGISQGGALRGHPWRRLDRCRSRGEFDFHLSHGKIGTCWRQPPSRFGEFHMEGDELVDFVEKPERHSAWINGGYFSFGANSPNTCLPTRGASWSAIPWRVWLAPAMAVFKHRSFWRVWTPGDRIGQASRQMLASRQCSGRARRRR